MHFTGHIFALHTVVMDVFKVKYCKFGNFREDFIFAKLRICEVS